MQKRTFYDFCFYFLIGTLYAYALCQCTLSATVFQVSATPLLLLCAGFILLFYGVFFNRYTMLAAGICVAVAVLVLFLSARNQEAGDVWYQQLTGYVRDMVLFFQNRQPGRPEYSQVFGVLVAFVFALLFALNFQVSFNFLILALTGFAVMLVPLFMQWGKSAPAVLLFILCIVTLFAKRMNLFASQTVPGSGRENAMFSLAAIPVCLALVGIAWLLPKPSQMAEEDRWAPQRIYDAADNLIYNMAPSQMISFSEPGERLGGPVELGNDPIMEVDAEERLRLAGSVRDVYTGSAWNISDSARKPLPATEEGGFDAGEYSQEMRGTQEYYMRYYDRSYRTMSVYLLNRRSRTVFVPAFRGELILPENYVPSMDALGAITLNKPMDRYSGYSVSYISWNYQSPYFVGYVLQGEGNTGSKPESFLELPEDLPERVRDLARKLTDGYAGDYDKIGALTAYLKQFPYTLEPSDVPRDADFVDYFLFEGREGYCVYFASALAVMGRCVDIPTRYVEGYTMPPEPGAGERYEITSANAHAWVEAYFPGLGWVPFEATPEAHLENAAIEEREETEPVPEQEQEKAEPETKTEPETPVSQPDREEPHRSEPEAMNPLPVILLVIVAVAGLSALFVKIKVSAYRSRCGKLEELPNREAVEAYYGRILQAAGFLGFPIRNNETAHAYAERLGDSLLFDCAVGMGELADLFSRASYSENAVSDEERGVMRRCYQELLRRLREEKWKGPGYFFHRYVLMQF